VILGFLGIDPSFHWASVPYFARNDVSGLWDLKQMEGDRLRYIFGRFWRRSISRWATRFVRAAMGRGFLDLDEADGDGLRFLGILRSIDHVLGYRVRALGI
jgi:hypothetical protein